MTGLLVSVRNASEAAEAYAGGANVIDVKEPRRGALGAADAAVWHDVRQTIPSAVPISVALGELTDDAIYERAGQVVGLQYAKVGMAGCLALPDWTARWQRVLERLPRDTARVAVAYADYRDNGAPDPHEVLRVAQTVDCRTLLLDTFAKDRGDLFGHMTDKQIRELVHACHAADVAIVLAGSLRLTTIERALAFTPKLVAVRGAACLGDRNQQVCPSLVKQLRERIAINFDNKLISS